MPGSKRGAVSTSNALRVTREGAWLLARFEQPQRALSWAIVGGGYQATDVVAWLEVKNADLPANVDPTALLRDRMREHGLEAGVGLLTSRRLDAFVDVTRTTDGVTARCVATVGLGNALRAGDAPVPIRPIGTINLMCHVSVPLTDEAMLEALALASEAKALAIREAEVPSFATRGWASGTGTDCIVMLAPQTTPHAAAQVAQQYAGKHTLIGYLIGAVTHEAIARGASAWKAEQR